MKFDRSIILTIIIILIVIVIAFAHFLWGMFILNSDLPNWLKYLILSN